MNLLSRTFLLVLAAVGPLFTLPLRAFEDIRLADVPDYSWFAGCFGTASGNLMGYWDRHGFPDFYRGPTAGGVAPLNSAGANAGIRSLWASRAGLDGRPLDQPGHLDDYWENFGSDGMGTYESGATDPHLLAGRAEHAPDCVGDFIGASQNKWGDLNGECRGNINAFAFNYWQQDGGRRENYFPAGPSGAPIPDIQSGWIKWAEAHGSQANTFSQLADFNPHVPPGSGFTFEDLKAEIDAGYPVLLFLQNPGAFSRNLPGFSGGNPFVHAMLAYGYVSDTDLRAVRYRTSWASGDRSIASWSSAAWEAGLAVRGVIGFRPLPKIRSVQRKPDGVHLTWDGPSSTLLNVTTGASTPVHWYVIERSDVLDPSSFEPVTEPSTLREAVIPDCCEGNAFFRVKLMAP